VRLKCWDMSVLTFKGLLQSLTRPCIFTLSCYTYAVGFRSYQKGNLGVNIAFPIRLLFKTNRGKWSQIASWTTVVCGFDWSWAADLTTYRGAHSDIVTLGCLIIFLILRHIGRKISTSLRMTSVSIFLYQITLIKLMTRYKNASYPSIEWRLDETH